MEVVEVQTEEQVTIVNVETEHLGPTAITNKPTITGAVGDYVLVSDSSDGGALKKVDLGNLLGGGGGGSGSAWHDGSGVPDDTLGLDGDYYINNDNGDYYAKAGGAYALQGNLQGPQGIQGATGADGADGNDGKTLLNGASDPLVGDGVDGDFFINTTSNTIFGPKTGGAWGSGVSIVGPQGATGPQGVPGPGGSATQWRQGSGVPSDGLGVDNDFYIDTVTYEIYQKQTGSYVSVGNIKGDDGATGSQGATGTAGADGSDGADGKTVLNGTGVPSGGLGVDGDFYIDTTNLDFYGPKVGGAWGAATAIVTPAGTQTLTNKTISFASNTLSGLPVELVVTLGDEDTAADTGTAIVTFRMPYAMTVTEVFADCTTAPTGSTAIHDINANGTSILGTKLSIDAGETDSDDAVSQATITTSSLAKRDQITIDRDQVGANVAGAGYKITIAGTRA